MMPGDAPRRCPEHTWRATGRSIYHHSLDDGPGGRPTRFTGKCAGPGKALPRVLVSALRVCATAGSKRRRRAGPDAGVLRAPDSKELSRFGGPFEGEVPHLFAGGAGELSGQGVEPGPSPEARGRGRPLVP